MKAQNIKISTKYQIVIPRDIRKRLGLVPHTRLLVEEIDGVIFIISKPKSFAKMAMGLGKDLSKSSKTYIDEERSSW